MYPDLSYLFHDLFGTATDNWTSIFKTFGVFLVLALLSCGVLLKYELKRLEKIGWIQPTKKMISVNPRQSLSEILFNGVFFTFFLAKAIYIFSDFESFKSDPAGILFSSKGSWVFPIMAGLGYIIYNFLNTSKLPTETFQETLIYPSTKTNDIIIVAGLSGVAGSKLFSVLEDLSGFIKDPVSSFFSGSGLNVYGGIIVAFVVVYAYVKKLGIKPIYMMDISGMGILLGYAIGRMGCQFSGDGDWGIVATSIPDWWFLPEWIWSYNYPNNVNNDGVLLHVCNADTYNAIIAQGYSATTACLESCGFKYCHEMVPKVFPTPIYETTFGLLFFIILFKTKHLFKVPGTLFFLYMILNGIERYLIEMIRVNDKYSFAGLEWTQAQYISILFAVVGIVGIVIVHRKS
jgi:prolipoprotein diacylglyceryltransferase